MNIEQLHSLFLSANGISTDTRKLIPDSIFFALKGDNFNGNKFAADALKGGCSFAVIDEKEYATSDQCILVDDVLKSLQNLANFHRKQFNIPVIGITGSNGKTTTKELIGSILSTTYNTLITEGNLNNHLGVPLTLLRMNMDHEIAIIEMGASKPGDIKELSEIAEPTHGIITNIGAAHIEGFGSLQGVVKTKTELYRFVQSTGGILFCNTEDETLNSNLPSDITVIYYGKNSGSVTGNITSLTPFVNFVWSENNQSYPEIKSNLVGAYNLDNFLSAICIGRFFNVSAESISQALTSYSPSNKRSQVEKTERNTLIVDCYNANATSMRAALENFVAIPHQNKLAILGDMLELGPISIEEHQKIADYVSDKKMEVILVGDEFGKINSEFQKFKTSDDLLKSEKLKSINNHLVLIKGSRGIKLETVIPEL